MRVTACAELDWPIVTEPNVTTAGVDESEPEGMPFPTRETMAGATPAEVVLMVTEPACMPVATGL